VHVNLILILIFFILTQYSSIITFKQDYDYNSLIMKITLKEIAKLAGVSRGTVDRAINNRGQIAPEIKQRIIQIAEQHGYRKNIIASNLAKNKKISIDVILPDPDFDSFWEAPLKGIKNLEPQLSNFRFSLQYRFFRLDDSNSYSAALNDAIQSKPDGILTAPVFLKESMQYFKIAEQNNIPFICINSEINHTDIISYIGQNSFECGHIAGSLFDKHKTNGKDIIVLTLGHDTNNAVHINNKIEGLREYNSINKRGCTIQDYVIPDFENTEVLKQLVNRIEKRKDNIRGIFFTNSRAYKFLNATKLNQLLLPEVTYIGFDLVPENIALLKSNQLTYILNQSPQKQGYLGVMNFFNYFIYNRELSEKIYLPIDIVIKENCDTYLNSMNNIPDFLI